MTQKDSPVVILLSVAVVLHPRMFNPWFPVCLLLLFGLSQIAYRKQQAAWHPRVSWSAELERAVSAYEHLSTAIQ